MREREELKKAIEQSDRLLSRVRQLEEENAELSKEKSDTFLKMRAVSRLGFYLWDCWYSEFSPLYAPQGSLKSFVFDITDSWSNQIGSPFGRTIAALRKNVSEMTDVSFGCSRKGNFVA